MAIFAKDRKTILQESLEYIKNNTGLNASSPGSKIRTIIELFTDRLNEAYLTFDYNTAVSFIHAAEGEFLDFLGESVTGIKRIQGSTASADSSSQLVKFYTNEPNFGFINQDNSNNPQDIIVPANTIIKAIKNGKPINYRTTSQAVLSKDQNEAYVSVESTLPGVEGNVLQNSLNSHEFSGYTNASENSLLITNTAPILNGRAKESDNNYRYRIINFAKSKNGSHLTRIRLAALSVPGVADVVVTDNSAQSFGSVHVFVKSTTPKASSELLEEVQRTVDEIKTPGSVITVEGPEYIEIGAVISIVYKPGISNSEKTNAARNARNAFIEYVNNLDIGEDFVYNTAANLVITSDSNIISIGKPGKFFDNIYLSAKYGQYTAMIYKDLSGNFSPGDFAKIIAKETSPVQIG